jgi:hypothetical protein
VWASGFVKELDLHPIKGESERENDAKPPAHVFNIHLLRCAKLFLLSGLINLREAFFHRKSVFLFVFRMKNIVFPQFSLETILGVWACCRFS